MDAKCEENFYTLKKCLTTTPIITLLQGVDRFVICTYAFNLVYGVVLMHQGKVIVYASRHLKVYK